MPEQAGEARLDGAGVAVLLHLHVPADAHRLRRLLVGQAPIGRRLRGHHLSLSIDNLPLDPLCAVVPARVVDLSSLGLYTRRWLCSSREEVEAGGGDIYAGEESDAVPAG